MLKSVEHLAIFAQDSTSLARWYCDTLGFETVVALEDNDPRALGRCFTEQWQVKYRAAPSPIHDAVHDWISEGRHAGARPTRGQKVSEHGDEYLR